MAYRKKTLARMLPTEREVARLGTDLERVSARLKKMLPLLHSYEALARVSHRVPVPRPEDPIEQDMLRKVSEDLKF